MNEDDEKKVNNEDGGATISISDTKDKQIDDTKIKSHGDSEDREGNKNL